VGFVRRGGEKGQDGPMRVRTALALINQGLDEVLSELESEFDPDTRWALAWFEQHQFDDRHTRTDGSLREIHGRGDPSKLRSAGAVIRCGEAAFDKKETVARPQMDRASMCAMTGGTPPSVGSGRTRQPISEYSPASRGDGSSWSLPCGFSVMNSSSASSIIS